MTGYLFDSSAPSESTKDWFTAHCDGGARGNPGPAGYGAVIQDGSGQTVVRLSRFLGIQTNNYAEYSGLLAVLQWALEKDVKRLRVISDSELMVKQMKGQYKVKSPSLVPLWQDARRLASRLEGFEMRHTLRGGNKEADQLANDAMDKGMGKSRERSEGAGERAGSPRSGSESAPQPKAARQVLEGFVKNGVVHLLEGELPDGIFVKIIRE